MNSDLIESRDIMARCMQCDNPVSPNAYTCPHCGEPDPCGVEEEYQEKVREKQAAMGLGAVIGAVMAIALIIALIIWANARAKAERNGQSLGPVSSQSRT
jgi:hypothetical protein